MCSGRAHRLRHGQGRRARCHHRRGDAPREDRWQGGLASRPVTQMADGEAMRAAILTISTSRSEGGQEDESGPALARFAQDVGAEVTATDIIPDDQSKIEWALRHYADSERCDLVLTTGGTGFAPDDVTPEATRAV